MIRYVVMKANHDVGRACDHSAMVRLRVSVVWVGWHTLLLFEKKGSSPHGPRGRLTRDPGGSLSSLTLHTLVKPVKGESAPGTDPPHAARSRGSAKAKHRAPASSRYVWGGAWVRRRGLCNSAKPSETELPRHLVRVSGTASVDCDPTRSEGRGCPQGDSSVVSDPTRH